MGPGGYRLWEPRWEKMENELRARGIRPGTKGWDPRAKSWWYGHGGTLNPETGECVYRGKLIKPTQALINAMRDAQQGKIKFNRENDALTKALGNPEHGGRVRGMGHIPWKIGFPQNDDPYGYRSRKRKMDREADVVARLASEMDVMKKTVSVLVAERDAARAQHEDHPADLRSQQRRSSVASTEAPPAGADAPTIEITAPEPLVVEITAPEPLVVEITAPEPPRYPVDDIKEMKECHLYYPIGNMSMKVAIGSALPCLPGALHHNNPIQDGYARVTVEDIVQGFEDLEIDIATPEGEKRLGYVKRHFILWQKKFIKFPGEAPRTTSPPPTVVVVAVAVVVVVVVVAVHLHLRHVSRRPPVHNVRRVIRRRPPVLVRRVIRCRPPIHLRQRSRSSPGLLTRTLMYLRPQRYRSHH